MRSLLRSALPFAAAALLASCGAGGSGSKQASRTAGLNVVTTFLPITEFTRAVAGDCATVQALIPTNVGPHDFQATPTDLARLRKADVLVKNGLGLEQFLGKLIASAGNANLRVIDSSAGIDTLANPGAEPGHDHGHDHGTVNPHIWLDPLRAVQQVETIRDGLIAARPACRQQFTANAAAFTGKLRALDADLARRLRPFAGKTFVAFHDFAPYFADRYQLRPDFMVEVPEENPTPADLHRVARQVKQSDLRALLSEPQEGSRSFNALAADLGVRVSVFDPLETGPAEAGMPGFYAVRMRRNVEELVSAFGG
jgi:zinc/manganese transport system substrate-binding protein